MIQPELRFLGWQCHCTTKGRSLQMKTLCNIMLRRRSKCISLLWLNAVTKWHIIGHHWTSIVQSLDKFWLESFLDEWLYIDSLTASMPRLTFWHFAVRSAGRCCFMPRAHDVWCVSHRSPFIASSLEDNSSFAWYVTVRGYEPFSHCVTARGPNPGPQLATGLRGLSELRRAWRPWRRRKHFAKKMAGSFSAVSRPIFARKCAFFSIFQPLQKF